MLSSSIMNWKDLLAHIASKFCVPSPWGLSHAEMVEDLDKETVVAIAKKIYTLLEAEVKKHMLFVFMKHRHPLFSAKEVLVRRSMRKSFRT